MHILLRDSLSPLFLTSHLIFSWQLPSKPIITFPLYSSLPEGDAGVKEKVRSEVPGRLECLSLSVQVSHLPHSHRVDGGRAVWNSLWCLQTLNYFVPLTWLDAYTVYGCLQSEQVVVSSERSSTEMWTPQARSTPRTHCSALAETGGEGTDGAGPEFCLALHQ